MSDEALPEMTAGCHSDEEPEVYTGKTAFMSSLVRFLSGAAIGADKSRSAPMLSGMLTS